MTTLDRISSKVSALLCVFSMLAEKKADLKKLTHHILDLNQKKSSTEIMQQSASCLKEIINYQLFAFALKNENQLNVWFDPSLGRKSIENIILKDFGPMDHYQVNFIDLNLNQSESTDSFDIDSIVSYKTRKETFLAKIYIVPGKTLYSYHNEIADIVLQSSSIAVFNQQKIENLLNAASIDVLTGCYNRRELENQLKKNVAGALRHKSDLSILIFDLDHFKKVNDTFGHLAGDMVLKQIASEVQKNMRKGDVFARFGGEEFIAILPGTKRKKALELAERLRIKISKKIISYNNHKIRVTASFGVTQLGYNSSDMTELIKDADDMLYKAKIKGRNMVMPGLMKIILPPASHEIKQSMIV